MKESVKLAFKKFDEGFRPDGYKPPKYWHVVGENGKLYPAKGIWAIANETNPGRFNTRHAVKGLADLDYSLIDTRALSDNESFSDEVQRSENDSSEARRKRLKGAPKKPSIYTAVITQFKRNPDVVVEALLRANGFCEGCSQKAPFSRKKDGAPYLEVHHKIQLSEGGDDTVDNAISLCPNCHRKAHYG